MRMVLARKRARTAITHSATSGVYSSCSRRHMVFFFAACAAQEGRKKDTKKKNNAHYIIIQWRSWTVVHKCKTDKDTRNERLVFIASDLDGQKQQITNEYKIDDGLKLTSMRFRCGHFLRK